MKYANLEDINTHLPEDKLVMTDANSPKLMLDAERIIRGYLVGVIEPAKLAAWVDPDHTPELIRSIAGRLIAAAYYATRYSEDAVDIPKYAQNKYNEALNMLQRIQSGKVVLVDVDGVTIDRNAAQFDTDWFRPNDSKPTFTMGQKF